MHKFLAVILFLFIAMNYSNAQSSEEKKKEKEYTYQTFKSHALINQQTVETLQKNKFDFRIGHRFGDFGGLNGGWPTFFGLESAADVLIGGYYGFTDNLTVGLSRTKGSSLSYRQNINASGKWKVISQTTDFKTPITLTLHHMTSISTQESSGNETTVNNFDQFAHRLSFVTQAIIGSKLNDRISLQLTPTWSHRNAVVIDDKNDIFALGLGGKLQFSKHFGFITEATFPISEFHTADNGLYPSIGAGLEIETAGHVFQLNFTNSTGIAETDYIPFTTTDWTRGEFRFGFTISRQFNL